LYLKDAAYRFRWVEEDDVDGGVVGVVGWSRSVSLPTVWFGSAIGVEAEVG
jgi:hypothetical protein